MVWKMEHVLFKTKKHFSQGLFTSPEQDYIDIGPQISPIKVIDRLHLVRPRHLHQLLLRIF